ncbi:major histocompatibility complex class I-related gene protein-like [Crotalus tigris]|uniref:major histocompatibility complex class I-related gene protein-like n=1 Tax=Crotalus tigris TaxID=88082 RepID=UPI00192F7ADF|nr:major histocompatibility complex class I-related gene protein-like [Crotalus tigris]
MLALMGLRTVATLVILLGQCGFSLSHSLWFSYLQVSEPNLQLPQFFSKVYLDDQPIACYDSQTRRVEPLVSWMEKMEKEDPKQGKEGNEMLLATEQVFRHELKSVWQNGGLHTWQAILGCELKEDGSKGGFLHYGYDGMDFISFDKETFRWVTAQPQAEKVKEKWEDDPGWSERNKIYLETCIEQLQSYLSYSKEVLQRIANRTLHVGVTLATVAAFILLVSGIIWMKHQRKESVNS